MNENDVIKIIFRLWEKKRYWFLNSIASLFIYHHTVHSCHCFIFRTECRAFSHDIMAAMLVFQTNPVGVKLFSYVNTFFWFTKLICIDASHVSEKALLILLPTMYEPTCTYTWPCFSWVSPQLSWIDCHLVS